jgi:hypothetical protein
MNGTQFIRRSARSRIVASVAAAISCLAVASCGVDFNGLFTGDAGAAEDAPAGNDARNTDGGSDARAETGVDGAVVDTAFDDAGRADVTTDSGAAADTRVDSRVDAVGDVAPEGGGRMDAGDGALVDADASRDGDGVRDAGAEPPADIAVQDAATEPLLDVTNEPSIDVAADIAADATSDAADGAPPGTCGGGCNTFANISPVVSRTVEQGDTPMMTGGAIVDGTYIVSSVVQYNGDMSLYSLAETSIIAGNVDAWVSSINGGVSMRYTTTYTTTNNQMAFDICCPTGGSLTILYTSNGTTLSHVDPANPNRVITYTRQ